MPDVSNLPQWAQIVVTIIFAAAILTASFRNMFRNKRGESEAGLSTQPRQPAGMAPVADLICQCEAAMRHATQAIMGLSDSVDGFMRVANSTCDELRLLKRALEDLERTIRTKAG